MRDPRDVAVSYYHFHRRDSGPNHPAGDDMESFVGLDTRDSEIGFAVRETSFERLQAAERTQKQREDHGASEQRSHGGMFRQ